MDNRESHEKTWAGLFQSSVRIEELESRQFLTAVVVAQHVEVIHAHQAVAKAAHVVSEAPAAIGEQSVRESTAEASNNTVASNTSRQAAIPKMSKAAATEATTEDLNSEEDAAPASTDDSASPGESRRTDALEAKEATSGNEALVARSLARTSTATSSEQLEPATISNPSEMIVTSQLATGGTAVFENSGNSSGFTLPTVHATPVSFSNIPILEQRSGTTEPQPSFLAVDPGGGFSTNTAGKLGNETAFVAAIFSSKSMLEQPSGALSGVLANLANRAVELSKTESGAIEAAAAPFFYFPRINWVGALSDAWESFAQESMVLPTAEVGRIRAWVVTVAVGVADTVLVGYWIWSKRRRETALYANWVAGCLTLAMATARN